VSTCAPPRTRDPRRLLVAGGGQPRQLVHRQRLVARHEDEVAAVVAGEVARRGDHGDVREHRGQRRGLGLDEGVRRVVDDVERVDAAGAQHPSTSRTISVVARCHGTARLPNASPTTTSYDAVGSSPMPMRASADADPQVRAGRQGELVAGDVGQLRVDLEHGAPAPGRTSARWRGTEKPPPPRCSTSSGPGGCTASTSPRRWV
jgi:hypothetical protein